MSLLLFFALPISTIILSIVLQKILKCPILVALTFFAIYLIVAFAVFDYSFLVLAILYTILSYITAWITKFFCCLINSTSTDSENVSNANTASQSNITNGNTNNNCNCSLCNRINSCCRCCRRR